MVRKSATAARPVKAVKARKAPASAKAPIKARRQVSGAKPVKAVKTRKQPARTKRKAPVKASRQVSAAKPAKAVKTRKQPVKTKKSLVRRQVKAGKAPMKRAHPGEGVSPAKATEATRTRGWRGGNGGAPRTSELLISEGPIFLGETLEDDFPSVARLIHDDGRPPLRRIVDESGRVLSSPLVDDRWATVNCSGSQVLFCRAWSQTVFGLDPVADYALSVDARLRGMENGPYDDQTWGKRQLYASAFNSDALSDPMASSLTTVCPLGAEFPTWSEDGSRAAFVDFGGAHGSYLCEIDFQSGESWILAALPTELNDLFHGRLAYSADGQFLLVSGKGGTRLLDLRHNEFVDVPLPAATWGHARGSSWLIGTLPGEWVDGVPDSHVVVDWFDLESWTLDRAAVVDHGGVRPDFVQLDLSADGRFLAGVGSIGVTRERLQGPGIKSRVGVIDLQGSTIDAVAPMGWNGLPLVFREQDSPNWVRRPTRSGATVVSSRAERSPTELPAREFRPSDSLEREARVFFAAATHPSHPGLCAQEARAFNEELIDASGRKPWLESRLRLIPPPRPVQSDVVLWRGRPKHAAIRSGIHTARAFESVLGGDPKALLSEWTKALQEDPTDQQARRRVHQEGHELGPLEDLLMSLELMEILNFLEAGFNGPDPRLGGELRLRYCQLAGSAGMNISAIVEPLANSTDHYLAPRAQVFAAISRYGAGEKSAAFDYVSRAAAGPDQGSAALALELATRDGWANGPEFSAVAAALTEQ